MPSLCQAVKLTLGTIFGSLAMGATGCAGDSQPTATTEYGLDAAIVVNQRTTIDTVVSDQCTGEDIALSGTAHVVFSTTQSGSGFHLQFHMNQRLTGTGLASGRLYQSISADNFTLNAPGLPFEQTSASSARLLSRGAGGDLFSRFLQHIVVDGQGRLRVFNTDFKFECT